MIATPSPTGATLYRRALLKDSTAELHRRLDEKLSELEFTNLSGYRAFLVRTARALLPLESLLLSSNITAVISDWALRSRSVELTCDLSGVGALLAPIEAQRRTLDRDESLGVLYVLEGSRLGGQLLLRRVMSSADPRVRANVRYLACSDAACWRSFLAVLESMTAVDTEKLIGGAHYAFELFGDAFADRLDPSAHVRDSETPTDTCPH